MGTEFSLPASPDGYRTVGVEVNRKRRRELVVGSIVAAGVAAIILSVVSLTGFASPAGGDLMVTPISGLTLATLLVGMLTLLSLEMAHVSNRQARHVMVVRTAGRPTKVSFEPH